MQNFLMALLLVCCLFTLPARAQTFGAEEFTLSNGMQVVVIPNHRAPVITHMVWMKVGAADELPGLSGMAHYFEHLMFKGTAKLAPGMYSKTIRTLGGNDNAFTGQDYTAYFETISVTHLAKVMEMNADRLVHLNPPEAHFKSEKAVVIEERRQRTENDVREAFSEQMNAALYVNHPYALPVIGWMSEIEDYEWVDVKKFYDAWYAPNNAILVVSGDITAAELKPLAEKTYGAIARKDLPPRKRPEVAPAVAQDLLTLRHPTIHQDTVQKIYIAPASAKAKQDSLALEVLAEILDGGPTTRLYKNLVVDGKKAVSVFFGYSGTALDYGRITMGGVPADGVSLEQLDSYMLQEIADVIADGVTEQEVTDAIQRLQDQAVFARDSVSGPAMIFGAALSTGSTVRDIEHWSTDIGTVTAAQVKAAAVKYLNPASPWIRPPVTGYMMPPLPQSQTVQTVPATGDEDATPAAKEPADAR